MPPCERFASPGSVVKKGAKIVQRRPFLSKNSWQCLFSFIYYVKANVVKAANKLGKLEAFDHEEPRLKDLPRTIQLTHVRLTQIVQVGAKFRLRIPARGLHLCDQKTVARSKILLHRSGSIKIQAQCLPQHSFRSAVVVSPLCQSSCHQYR